MHLPLPAILLAALLLRVDGPRVAVDVADGAVVADIRKVTAAPSSQAGIARVEFSVDDQLKATVTKPPFEYKWDTIDENEGAHTLIVAVFDTDGKAGRKRVKLEVDNGLTLGIKPHAEKALALFRKGDAEGCSLEGRKAYRINNADVDAIRAMAAGVGAKGDLNRGIDMLEKPPVVNNQVMGDPKRFPLTDLASLELRAIFHLRRAALQPAAAMLPDVTAGYDAGKKLLDSAIDALRAAHPEPFKALEDRLAVADGLFYQGEYERALDLYRGGSDPAHQARIDARVAMCQLRLGRFPQVELMVNGLISSGKSTDALRALLAAAYLGEHKFARARVEAAESASRKSPTAMLVAAYAAIGERDYRRALEMLEGLAQRTDGVELHYAAGLLWLEQADVKRSGVETAEALARAPTLPELYVQRAFELALLVPKDGFDQGATMLDFVLARSPKCQDARIARVVAFIQQKKFARAEPLLRELMLVEHEAADVWLAQAALFAEAGDRARESQAKAEAKRLQPDLFTVDLVPLPRDFMIRVARYRRPPLVTPAILDLEEGGR